MAKKYYLYVTVTTPVGVFSGYVNKNGADDKNELSKFRDDVQKRINQMSYMVIFPTTGDDEITLPGELMKNSVFKFSIG